MTTLNKKSFEELTNLAAVRVFLNGGKVYLSDREALPLPYTPVNALYRY